MSAEWAQCPLGDVITLQRGHDLPTQHRKTGTVPIIGSSGLTGYHDEYKAQGPGVVVGRSGNSMGEVSFCSVDFWPLNTALYITDFKGNDERFIYYLLKTINFDQFNSGSAQKSLNRNAVYPYEVRLPKSIGEQKRISSILTGLEEKLELNQKINQTLEQMAQAIFKSWFVDFEPVKAKIAARERWYALQPGNETASSACYAGELADQPVNIDLDTYMNHAAMQAISGKDAEQLALMQVEKPEEYAELYATAELFPSAMQDSELGEMPEGWEVTTFGSVSNCFDKHRIPLSKREREQKSGPTPYYGATSVMDYVDEHIFDGIYLLLGEDGSVLRDDGSPFTQYIWGKSWVNNHAHVLQGANGVSTEQLLLFISTQNITAYVTGAVQLKLNQKNMNSIPFIKAPDELNSRFYELIKPLYSTLRSASTEIISLSVLRDTLLPKLLSGELSVADIETEVKA